MSPSVDFKAQKMFVNREKNDPYWKNIYTVGIYQDTLSVYDASKFNLSDGAIQKLQLRDVRVEPNSFKINIHCLSRSAEVHGQC